MVKIIAVKVSDDEYEQLKEFADKWNESNSPFTLYVSTMMKKLALEYVKTHNG